MDISTMATFAATLSGQGIAALEPEAYLAAFDEEGRRTASIPCDSTLTAERREALLGRAT